MDEIDLGFRDGGGNSGGVCITGDGKGFSWHTDAEGNRIDDDHIKEFVEAMDGNGEWPPKDSSSSYTERLHGKAVSSRFEPFHDVTVYGDGHEEWFYIGE